MSTATLAAVTGGSTRPRDCTCQPLTAHGIPEGGYTYRVHLAGCAITQRLRKENR